MQRKNLLKRRIVAEIGVVVIRWVGSGRGSSVGSFGLGLGWSWFLWTCWSRLLTSSDCPSVGKVTTIGGGAPSPHSVGGVHCVME